MSTVVIRWTPLLVPIVTVLCFKVDAFCIGSGKTHGIGKAVSIFVFTLVFLVVQTQTDIS